MQSQLKSIIGITPTSKSKDSVVKVIQGLVEASDTFEWKVLVMGLGFLSMLVAMKEIGKRGGPRWKWMRTVGPLTVSVLGMVLSYTLDLQSHNIPVVGKFEAKNIPITFDRVIPDDFSEGFAVTTLLCTVVGLLESVSIAKRLSIINRYHIYPNQELRALGIANMLGSGFSAYPATGSFSRSAVANDTRCKTQLGGLVTSLVVLIIVLCLTGPFAYLPKSASAAIVVSGVIGLVDLNEALFLFRVNKVDFLVWATSFLCTLFLGPDKGLGIAIGLALLCVIYESAFPQVAELGRLRKTTVYRNVKQYPFAKRMKQVLILRAGAPMYFANCQYVRETFETCIERAERAGADPKVLIFEMSPVSHIDATGLHTLEDLIKDSKQRGMQIMLANPNQQVMQSMEQAGVLKLLGLHNVFVRVHDAVKECAHLLHAGGAEPDVKFFDDLIVQQGPDEELVLESPVYRSGSGGFRMR